MNPRKLAIFAFSGVMLTHCVSPRDAATHRPAPEDWVATPTVIAEYSPLSDQLASNGPPAPEAVPFTPQESWLSPPQITWNNPDTGSFDTWQVMSERMRFANGITKPSVENEVRKFRDNPRLLTSASEHASLYLPYVTRRLMERDLPPELALLPFMESAYNPRAVSPHGAAGLWQIQPATGDVLGLKRDQWYDARQDVVRSTDAMLDYFEHLRQTFDGDWLLALAAFNSGEKTVSNAIQRNLDRGKRTDFWALDLPEHTRSYVPRFLALARIFQNPEENQFLLPLNPNTSLESVTSSKQISLERAAELADVDYGTLKRLNTGLKNDVTPPGNYQILLPANAAQRFEAALLKTPAATPAATAAPSRTVSQRAPVRAKRIAKQSSAKPPIADYRVQAGDSLWAIARRFKVSPTALMHWNDIDDPEALHPGKNLKIMTR